MTRLWQDVVKGYFHVVRRFRGGIFCSGKAPSVSCATIRATTGTRLGAQKEKRRCRSPFARKRNTGKSSHAPTLSLYHKKMLLVNTLSEGFRNFSLLHKNVLKASAKMSIEKCENICYNEITKQEEVQSDETLISTTFIHKISSFVHNDSGTDTHHSSYREIF